MRVIDATVEHGHHNLVTAFGHRPRAHRADVGGAGLVLHFQERTAPEVDAEIQPMGEEQHDRDN